MQHISEWVMSFLMSSFRSTYFCYWICHEIRFAYIYIRAGSRVCSSRLTLHTQTDTAEGEMGTGEPYHCDSYYDGWLYHLREEIPLSSLVSSEVWLLSLSVSLLSVCFLVLGSKGDISKVVEGNKWCILWNTQSNLNVFCFNLSIHYLKFEGS